MRALTSHGGTVRRLGLAAILALGVCGVARADYMTGVRAYTAGDYAAAITEWRPLAEKGDAASQYGMGLIYESGRGVGRDDAKAAHWYRLAAEQGNAAAQFNLGGLYRRGAGVDKDMAQAVHWWRLAAEQGLSQAELALGMAYQQGEGVNADPRRAVAWFERAAQAGLPTAQYALGLAYETGRGVTADAAKAHHYIELAAKAGLEPAIRKLGGTALAPPDKEPPTPPTEAEVAKRLATAMKQPVAATSQAPAGSTAPSAPAAAPASTAKQGDERYIQLAAYGDRAHAEQAWKELAAKQGGILGGLPHRIVEADLGGTVGKVYRLQAGPVPDEREATAICALLKARKTACFVAKP